MGLLVSRGEEVFTPGSDASLHPLLVPLTRSAVDGEITGLLRWPGKTEQLPVVRTNGTQLDLLALRTDQYVHREAILADTNDAADKGDLATLAEQYCKAWDPEAAANAPGGLQCAADAPLPATATWSSGSATRATVSCSSSRLAQARWWCRRRPRPRPPRASTCSR